MNWDDLKHFLAAHRAGSLAGAGRLLGVEHTTIARRLAALEDELGAKLFLKQRSGFELTAEGREILVLAEQMERMANAITQRAQAGTTIDGTVRLTTSETFAGFIARRLGELRARHPNLLVEILAGNQNLDLTRGEADLAIRLASTAESELLVKRLALCGWGVYAAKTYVARTRTPKDATNLGGHDVIAYDETMKGIPGAQWLEQHGAGTTIVFKANSITAAANAAIAGLGVAALPLFMGAVEPTLQRIGTEVIGTRTCWLVVHPDAANVPRIRAVMDFLEEVIVRERPLLEEGATSPRA